MRTSKLVILVLCALSTSAWAQTYPKIEASAGYAYLRFHPSTGSAANCSGGYGSIEANLNSWFGVIGDVDVCRTNRATPASNGTSSTFLLGSKFDYRRCCRVTPYGQLLVGGMHGTAGFPGLATSATAFSLAAGGGLEVKPWRSCLFAIKVAEANYLLTRFNGTNQNNFQFKTGIVFQWW